ncbi:MAG: methyltransferase type 11 [Proteobacteria bacterium]|nr:methyltransferase type 11 [Pseudomonadota bacterium]
MKTIEWDSLILIMYKDRKYLKRISQGQAFHGKGGILSYSELIGKTYGIRFGQYEIFEPSLEDIVMYGLRRETQIVFPKDAAFICFKLGLKNGSRIVEIGTGSGVLTFMFSRIVGPHGKVVSFEKEERHYKNAKKNMERFAEWNNTELYHNEEVDCAEEGFDAAFIDVREPWMYFEKSYNLLKESGLLGIIVPTANQISDILKEAPRFFSDIEVIEIMLRKYKTVAERVRPFDRMVAHTGYLVFGRKLRAESQETMPLCANIHETLPIQ